MKSESLRRLGRALFAPTIRSVGGVRFSIAGIVSTFMGIVLMFASHSFERGSDAEARSVAVAIFAFAGGVVDMFVQTIRIIVRHWRSRRRIGSEGDKDERS